MGVSSVTSHMSFKNGLLLEYIRIFKSIKMISLNRSNAKVSVRQIPFSEILQDILLPSHFEPVYQIFFFLAFRFIWLFFGFDQIPAHRVNQIPICKTHELTSWIILDRNYLIVIWLREACRFPLKVEIAIFLQIIDSMVLNKF